MVLVKVLRVTVFQERFVTWPVFRSPKFQILFSFFGKFDITSDRGAMTQCHQMVHGGVRGIKSAKKKCRVFFNGP